MQVFISYAHKDEAIAKEISSQLSEAGLKVWLGARELLPGENWSLGVGKALERSNAMVVLLSPDAVKSEVVRREVAFALASPRYEERVVPVVIRPTKEVPWFLARLQAIQGFGGSRMSKQIAQKIADALKKKEKGEESEESILGTAKAAHA